MGVASWPTGAGVMLNSAHSLALLHAIFVVPSILLTGLQFLLRLLCLLSLCILSSG